MPERVQLKRTKGWRMPPNTVKVDRTTRWGNDFTVGDDHSYYLGDEGRSTTAEQCVGLFRRFAEARPADESAAWLSPLRGRNLACWCKPGAPCHADVLLELANRPAPHTPLEGESHG